MAMRHGTIRREAIRCGAAGVAGLLLAASLLGGCSDRVLDHGVIGALTGEATPGDGPSPVRRMGGGEAEFPNLATVPPRPTDFSTPRQRRQDMESLARDRADAQGLQRAAGIEGVPAPLEVPPPPNLRPGAP